MGMFAGKKVVVVMPAYNAAQTLHEDLTRRSWPRASSTGSSSSMTRASDETAALARTLPGVKVHRHPENRGYGANQKTCYRMALEEGADIVIMVHPDYQYTPKLIPAMASLIGNGLYECVLGSRILGGHALRGGMPLWRYVSQPVPDPLREYSSRAASSPSITRATGPFPARFWRSFRWRGTPTISSSTIRCFSRCSGTTTRSPRSAAPRAITPTLHPSISVAASATASGASRRPCSSGCPVSAWSGLLSSRADRVTTR
ncbi:MAG: glycosyltransferase [Desulfobacterales bacterium]|nr:glycosyltransferase [Desulfobacterales bacterium]